MSAAANRRPEYTRDPRDPEGFLLNTAAILRTVWELDVADLADPRKRLAVLAWRERVYAVHRACTVMACPPTMDDLLWEHGHGDDLKAAILRGENDFLDVITREP